MYFSLKIAGESGMGIESTGDIVAKSLQDVGYYIYLERDFQSLIKGGRASVQISIYNMEVRSVRKYSDISLALDREGLYEALETTKNGGIIINGFERYNRVIKNLNTLVDEKKIQLINVPSRSIAQSVGGGIIMANTVIIGFLWKLLNLPLDILTQNLKSEFAQKPQLIDVNLKCLEEGYNYQIENLTNNLTILLPIAIKNKPKTIFVDGNHSLTLGAIRGGLKNYYAYPMSPSSSILEYMCEYAYKYHLLVKQSEDEITAVQMALGSFFAGNRSLVATSGGGFDLMTETISLSAMIESPLVVAICQRPGPATGLPTKTAQGDLNLAIYSGHGEFTRCVISCSDNASCFDNIQLAFNISEKWQIPVLVLLEANLCMSKTSTQPFKSQIPIERHLLTKENFIAYNSNQSNLEADNLEKNTNQIEKNITSTINQPKFKGPSFQIIVGEEKTQLESKKDTNLEDLKRYELTSNGVSDRWLVGSGLPFYYANGDEHKIDGSLTEEPSEVDKMVIKRNRKFQHLKNDLPEPILYGPEDSKYTLVSFGSTKNVVLDSMNVLNYQKNIINYLHYEFVWPLKTDFLEKLFLKNNFFIAVENNYQGQFKRLIETESLVKFKISLRKWNGKPFYLEEIIDSVREIDKVSANYP